MQNQKSILYTHVFSRDDYYNFNKSLFFLYEEKINKNNYIIYPESRLKIIKNNFNKYI